MEQQQNKNLEKLLQKVVRNAVHEEVRPIKKSMKNFATKDDLNDFRDRAFKVFATKDDLNDFRDRAFKVFATKDDLREMTNIIIEKTEMKRNEVLDNNDKVAGKMSKIEQEQAADTIGNIRRDERLDELEQDVKQVKSNLKVALGAV